MFKHNQIDDKKSLLNYILPVLDYLYLFSLLLGYTYVGNQINYQYLVTVIA